MELVVEGPTVLAHRLSAWLAGCVLHYGVFKTT